MAKRLSLSPVTKRNCHGKGVAGHYAQNSGVSLCVELEGTELLTVQPKLQLMFISFP